MTSRLDVPVCFLSLAGRPGPAVAAAAGAGQCQLPINTTSTSIGCRPLVYHGALNVGGLTVLLITSVSLSSEF